MSSTNTIGKFKYRQSDKFTVHSPKSIDIIYTICDPNVVPMASWTSQTPGRLGVTSSDPWEWALVPSNPPWYTIIQRKQTWYKLIIIKFHKICVDKNNPTYYIVMAAFKHSRKVGFLISVRCILQLNSIILCSCD